jgi:hypothetical protein
MMKVPNHLYVLCDTYMSHVLLLCISFYAYWLYFIYVWHVYVSHKTYKWFGTFIIKDGRYTFTFLTASMSVSAILVTLYYNNMRYSGQLLFFVYLPPSQPALPHKCSGVTSLTCAVTKVVRNITRVWDIPMSKNSTDMCAQSKIPPCQRNNPQVRYRQFQCRKFRLYFSIVLK